MARKKAYAAIDVGSHEIQMQIAELDKHDRPQIIDTVRRTLPLGTDTYTSGRISQDVLNECITVLQGFVNEMKTYRIAAYRAVATSAFREAANRAYVLDQIEKSCGISIQILDNAEERAFHILAASTRYTAFPELIKQGTLLVDVGAGSIQVTVYDKGRFIFSQNMLLGSLRIRELLSDLERRTADFAGLMDEYISSDLDNYRQLEPKGILYQNLIVLGGEMAYVKKMADLDPGTDAVLSVRRLEQLYQLLLQTRPLDLAVDRGIPVDHATLLLPTVIILRKFIRFTSLTELQLPAADLCDAVQIEFARSQYGFKPAHDLAEDIISACRHIARRYHVIGQHMTFVERVSLQLFDETEKLHRLQARERLLLQAAVILHDAGKYINMSRHHVHSRNLILASEIIGLSLRETAIVAWTAGFHIGSFSMDEAGFGDLPVQDRLIVAKLTALLRIANALDSGHQQKINELDVLLDGDRMVLQTRTKADILLEIWALEKHGALFQELYGIKPVIKLRSNKT